MGQQLKVCTKVCAAGAAGDADGHWPQESAQERDYPGESSLVTKKRSIFAETAHRILTAHALATQAAVSERCQLFPTDGLAE
jgi:hypothetical protein